MLKKLLIRCYLFMTLGKLQQLLYNSLKKKLSYMQYFKFTVRIIFSKHGYVGVQNSSRIIMPPRENGLGFH